MNYYNEVDPYAAAWLRNLIAADMIPEGVVDERDINDVRPADLAGFTSCHFFAGLGEWPYALRLAGWPDDRPVWTGSCPCQPFSAAGKGEGFADERHLWPAWFWLIVQCRPDVVFGEQVDKALDWLDLVATDLEGEGYTCGPVVLPAAGVGAPHGRHRLWFVADNAINGLERRDHIRGLRLEPVEDSGDGASPVADTHQPLAGDRGLQRSGRLVQSAEDAVAGDVGDPAHLGYEWTGATWRRWPRPSDTGFWDECDWLPCRDGKFRPVEPGTFPLAHGLPNRVGRLRAYGNAIVPQEAAEVIRAYADTRGLTLD